MNSPLMDLTEIELRDLCRHHIDSFENWSRRLIDETFRAQYAEDYLNYIIPDINQPLVKAEIRKSIEDRMRENPDRYPRKIDAILLEDIEYFLCREDLYSAHFKSVLEPFYCSKEEVRRVMERLIPIRNKLSHGNTISIHEAEQCICYCNDFIEVYKKFYIAQGKEREYNVPVILRMKDSLGNDFVRENTRYSWSIFCHGNPLVGGGHLPKVQLRSGDRYKLWIEVDNSFDSSEYEVSWYVCQFTDPIKNGTGTVVDFTVGNKNVSYSPEIKIELTTKKVWHRFHKIDDSVEVHLMEVLPPIEETY